MIDFGTNESFIENYQKLKSSRKMADIYKCDKSSVLNHAKKIGYDVSNNKERKITQLSPQELIELYEKVQNCTEIGKMYNCSSEAVASYLHKIGYGKLKNINSKLTDICEEDFIEDYETLKSANKMGQLYGCSSTAILNYCKKIGYNPNSNKKYKLSNKDKQEIIAAYNTDLTSTDLSKRYNVSRGMITKIWYDNNLIGKTVKEFKTTEIDLQNKKFGKWTVLYKTDKRTAGGGIYWHCRCECGTERDVSSLSLTRGVSLSCGAHNISKGNEKIKKLLIENNIPFEVEKTFDTCCDKKKMPFDFYVNNSYLIEYDGVQHYDKESIFNHEYTVKHDKMKTDWCIQNGIPLIRIPYYHYDNLIIEDLLLETTNFKVDNAD